MVFYWDPFLNFVWNDWVSGIVLINGYVVGYAHDLFILGLVFSLGGGGHVMEQGPIHVLCPR